MGAGVEGRGELCTRRIERRMLLKFVSQHSMIARDGSKFETHKQVVPDNIEGLLSSYKVETRPYTPNQLGLSC